MANVWVRDRARAFYAGYGLLALAAVFIGFGTTYALPMARGTFVAPATVHLHGALCLAWVLLFILQTFLVRARRTPLHRSLGLAAIPIAVGILVSGMATAAWATERDLATVPTAPANMIGTLTSLSIFTGLVIFAIGMRSRPDWHKRLMMLATIVVLWPAFFRFRHLMPFVPQPEIWLALVLADLPILVAAVRDKLVYGRVHPVWWVFGIALVVEQVAELLLFETAFWNGLGLSLYTILA
jgi:hypothetical protein